MIEVSSRSHLGKPGTLHGRDGRATGKPVHRPSATDRFQLLVDCADEQDQRKLYEQLAALGRKCRVITI